MAVQLDMNNMPFYNIVNNQATWLLMELNHWSCHMDAQCNAATFKPQIEQSVLRHVKEALTTPTDKVRYNTTWRLIQTMTTDASNIPNPHKHIICLATSLKRW